MLTRTLPVPGAPSVWAPEEPLQAGYRDFDAMLPLQPGRVTLLDHPGGAGQDLLYALMADAAVLGRSVLVADGCNFLDVYHLARAARRRAGARLGPDAARRDLSAFEELVLDRVRVARGFTAHQLQAIVEEGLVREAAACPPASPLGLVVAPGLLDMYLDGELGRQEARVLAKRALETLGRLARAHQVPVLVANALLPPGHDHPLRVMLEGLVDEEVAVLPAPGRALRLRFPRRGAQFLSPEPGRMRLEDFLAPEDLEPVAQRPAPPVPRAPGPWPKGPRMFPVGRFKHAWPTGAEA